MPYRLAISQSYKMKICKMVINVSSTIQSWFLTISCETIQPSYMVCKPTQKPTSANDFQTVILRQYPNILLRCSSLEQSVTVLTRIELAIFAVTGQRDNRYTTGPKCVFHVYGGCCTHHSTYLHIQREIMVLHFQMENHLKLRQQGSNL